MLRQLLTLVMVSALVLFPSCGDDEPPGPSNGTSYAELILGAWEAEYGLDGGEVEYADEDDLFWYFLAGGIFRDVENNWDGTYDVDCPAGTYTITENSIYITCKPGDMMSGLYQFFAGGDSLKLGGGEDWGVFSRSKNAPDWRDWMP